MQCRVSPLLAVNLLFPLLAATIPTYAQDQETNAPSSAQPAAQKAKTTYFGSYRLRIEDFNWFSTPKADGAYTFTGSLLRLGVTRSTFTDDLTLEFEQPTLIDIPKNAIGPGSVGSLGTGASYFAADHNQSASFFIKQAFARFKRLGNQPADSFRMGRFEFADAAEVTPVDPSLNYIKQMRITNRLISPSNYTTVGRSMDGFQFLNNTRLVNISVVGAMPTRGAYSLNGWDTLDQIKVGYVAATFSQPGKRASGEERLFGLYYQDERNGVVKVDNRSSAARAKDTAGIHLGTFGGHYMRVFDLGPGRMDGLVWGAGQVGDWGSLTQAATAYEMQLGYQFSHTAWKPWLRIGYAVDSGDGDFKNNVHGTFIPLLTTSQKFARFPFYTSANLKDFFGQVILQPTRKLIIRSDVHGLRLADSNDLWYSGGGAYENLNFGYSGRPSGGHSDLGTLYDISFDYQALKELSVVLYFAYARGGNVVASTFTGKDATFGYLEMLTRF